MRAVLFHVAAIVICKKETKKRKNELKCLFFKFHKTALLEVDSNEMGYLIFKMINFRERNCGY